MYFFFFSPKVKAETIQFWSFKQKYMFLDEILLEVKHSENLWLKLIYFFFSVWHFFLKTELNRAFSSILSCGGKNKCLSKT